MKSVSVVRLCSKRMPAECWPLQELPAIFREPPTRDFARKLETNITRLEAYQANACYRAPRPPPPKGARLSGCFEINGKSLAERPSVTDKTKGKRMRSMHRMTAAAVAALLGLAFVSGAADAQTLPRQIVVEMQTVYLNCKDCKEGERWKPWCRQQLRYTFRAGRIFEEYPDRFCFGEQTGQEGVGLVFEPNVSTTSVRRCVQERGSQTLRCNDGMTDERAVRKDVNWEDHETTITTSSSITHNRIEIEHMSVTRGVTVYVSGYQHRYDGKPSATRIVLEFSRSGCNLERWELVSARKPPPFRDSGFRFPPHLRIRQRLRYRGTA